MRRTWIDSSITKAPTWCSVDLRDGNQALVNPMGVSTKLVYFRKLLEIGFREIEIGFPSASQIDFDFCRILIENEPLPNDVWLSVLVQARNHLIERTVEAVKGAKNVIIHIYNSTSTLQREVVFNETQKGVTSMICDAVHHMRSLVDERLQESNVRLQYSPESFTGTELPFACAISKSVCDVWGATPEHPMILNLPATVEVCGPHIFADMVDYVIQQMDVNEDTKGKFIFSVHPHNDRGTAVAAAELAMLAGATRVEGCLFGNGERTGNVCSLTLAMNLLTHGIDPKLDFSEMDSVVQLYQNSTGMDVHPRHPWAGRLTLTAFSGSHQDAIKKGVAAQKLRNDGKWLVPYLPLDPADIGRSYEAIVRINAQSGKSGVAFVVESQLGITMPKQVQMDFSAVVQRATDKTQKEMVAEELVELFLSTYYISAAEKDEQPILSDTPFIVLKSYCMEIAQDGERQREEHKLDNIGQRHPCPSDPVKLRATVEIQRKTQIICGMGNGPINAFVNGLSNQTNNIFHVLSYYQTAVKDTGESDAVSMCFVEIRKENTCLFGVGEDRNIVTASLKAVCSGVSRLQDEIRSEKKENHCI